MPSKKLGKKNRKRNEKEGVKMLLFSLLFCISLGCVTPILDRYKIKNNRVQFDRNKGLLHENNFEIKIKESKKFTFTFPK
jgi:hypothetical protein